MYSLPIKSVNLVLCLVLLLSIGCTTPSTQPDGVPATSPASPHTRTMLTPPYEGGAAVIFVLNQADDSGLQDAAIQIFRVFGRNDAPLSVAIKPPVQADLDAHIEELTYYSDAGIIDTSFDGHSIPWMKSQTPQTGTEYKMYTSGLTKTREQFRYVFGSPVFTCVLPPAAINEVDYNALQDSGFKVICYDGSAALTPSIKPVSWSGTLDTAGLYRLPIVGKTDFSQQSGASTGLYDAVKKSADALGVAVIEVTASSILDGNNKPDPAKLLQLADLIKSCSELGYITTLENWYRYSIGCSPDSAGIKRPLPPYKGGPVIVFRLDDVSKGNREEVVQEIIKLFQKNGVPLDCGVVSNANGTESYEMPWLKKYVDENVVGISVHGYDWTFYQLDLSKNYLKSMEDNPCIDIYAARAEAEKAKVSYAEVKFKLIQARCKFLKYFGINPISLTVPTDYYDELGYEAVQDAGYKVFSAHYTLEPCASTNKPVDFNCQIDLAKGLYRIPTASDMCVWDNCKWTDVINLDKPMKQKDYCIYIGAFGEALEYNDNGIVICNTMTSLGVAALGIHPDCFVDKDGKPDMAKLERLDAIIKWVKSFATIMTFEQWYRYKIGDK